MLHHHMMTTLNRFTWCWTIGWRWNQECTIGNFVDVQVLEKEAMVMNSNVSAGISLIKVKTYAITTEVVERWSFTVANIIFQKLIAVHPVHDIEIAHFIIASRTR